VAGVAIVRKDIFYLQATMPKRQKLWAVIDRIETSRDVTTGMGKKYLVHLVDGTKPVWVLSMDLSPGVAKNYDECQTTPKKAKAKVNRGFVNKPSDKTKRVLFGKADPIKLAFRNAKWVVAADNWVANINKVMGIMTDAQTY
jgi:hypothetical protein